MLRKSVNSKSIEAKQGLGIIRFAVAIILGVHSVSRIVKGDVSGFGTHLSSIGFPLGVALAWFITLITLCASIALIVSRFVVPACVIHIIVLIVGIVLVHAQNGWFVVGGGTNGMEYSVTLIACLFAIAWSYWPRIHSNN
jgi:putative oxidoreductase